MIKTSSAKAKGKLLENWIVERLHISKLDTRAYPQKGSGNGLNKGDIWNALDLHIECKNQKNFGGTKWFKQMREENVSHLAEVLVWKPSRMSLEETKVIIDWAFFEDMLVKVLHPTLANIKLGEERLKVELRKK